MSVYSLLKADAGVTALVNKIYITQAPQNTKPPYVVIRFININPSNLLSEVPNIEEQILDIDCISGDQLSNKTLFLACRDALEPFGYMQGTSLYAEQDKETGYFRTLFDYSFWNDR